MSTLTIVGAGRLGKTLGRLLRGAPGLRLQQVLNRSIESARAAIDFMGAGAAAAGYQALAPADYILVATPDEAIGGCAAQLAHSRAVQPGTIVFHCSGSQPAALLAELKRPGALIASVHPIKSFAEPLLAAASFAGTYCALEGEAAACEKLAALFAALGAKLFSIAPEAKLYYHAGTVFASNYLTALVETSLRCFEKAGLARPQAMACLLPLLEGTLVNNRELGPACALTGPIARGEAKLVAAQLAALRAWDPRVAEVYRVLGMIAVDLAVDATPEAVQEIRRILEPRTPNSELRIPKEIRNPKAEDQKAKGKGGD